MTRTAKAALAVSAALMGVISGSGLGTEAAGAPDAGATAAERDKPPRVVAPVTLRPAGDQQAAGVARLSAAPGRRAGIIAILIGLATDPTDPTGTVYRLAAGKAPCDRLPAGAGGLRRLEPPLDVAQDGTAVVVEGRFDDTDIVHVLTDAESLAVVGDWDGDGRDGVAACGDLDPLRVVHNPKVADGLLFASSPSAACATCGEGQLLGNLLTLRGDVDLRGNISVIGLRPEAGHVVGVSSQDCRTAGEDPDLQRVRRFRADQTGSAVLDLFVAPVHLDLLGIVVAEIKSDGLEVVACQEVTALPVRLK